MIPDFLHLSFENTISYVKKLKSVNNNDSQHGQCLTCPTAELSDPANGMIWGHVGNTIRSKSPTGYVGLVL